MISSSNADRPTAHASEPESKNWRNVDCAPGFAISANVAGPNTPTPPCATLMRSSVPSKRRLSGIYGFTVGRASADP
jgi:hypothetical protein